MQEAFDRSASQTQSASDLTDAPPLVMQRSDRFVSREPLRPTVALLALQPCQTFVGDGSWTGDLGLGCRRDGSPSQFDDQFLRGGAYRGMLSSEQTLYRFSQINKDMEAVSNLDGRWCSSASALGIRTGPITADDLDPGLRSQPLGECFGRSIRQQVDRSMTLVIDQNRAVGAAPLPSPVVHPHDSRRRCRRQRQSMNQPQQRHATGGPMQAGAQPSTRSTTERQPDLLQARAQWHSPTSVARGQPRYLFGKRSLWAAAIPTEEAANPKMDHQRVTDGFVHQAARIAAVDTP
jgi:hypothetical protein